jgi:hypothetical protein
MFTKKNKKMIINKKLISLVSIASFLVVMVGYPAVEPSISKAITDSFLVNLTVTGEISWSIQAADVTMAGSLPGITGGTSTGSTKFGVLTNNNTGYTVALKATSTPAMQGLTQGGTIANYTPVAAGVPDFSFDTSTMGTTGEFAYTLSASTTADMDASFKDNASACNVGSTDTGGSASCWLNASTSDETILNRSSETTSSGENTTIYFRTTINPSSFVIEDTYQATIVLTANMN